MSFEDDCILLHEIVDVESNKTIHCLTFPMSQRMGKDIHQQMYMVKVTCAPSLPTINVHEEGLRKGLLSLFTCP